jgi:hexosaminidase
MLLTKIRIYDSALDPTNPKHNYLVKFFDEVCPLFTSNYFHIGDENNGKEWNANPTIQEFKKRMK